MINPVQDITPDGRPMEGTAYPEHLAPGVSLDSGLRAGMSNLEPLQLSFIKTSLVARPQVEIRTSHWKPVINPVRDITPDGLPMEGTTCPEHPALGESLDSRLMEKLLCPEPLEQSVLGALLVIRTDETDRPKRPALASQLYHEQSCFQSLARPMLDQNIVNHTYVNDDIDTDLPESPAPMMNSPTVHERSCFNPEIVNQTYVNFDIDADLPENSAPMMSSDLMFVDWDHAIRRGVLRNRSMGYGSSREINDQLLSPEDANLSDAGIFLDQVRSEGLRQWSMAMDEEYHCGIFNRLPGYYGGDLYDTEDTDEFDPDVQEIMDFVNYAHSRPDGGETRCVDT